MNHSIRTIALGLFAGPIIAIGILVTSTDPDAIGPFGLTAFFMLVYVATTSLLYLLLRGLNYVYERKTARYRTAITAGLLGFAPVSLLGLNTLKQLNVLDIVLVVVLEFAVLFYASRR